MNQFSPESIERAERAVRCAPFTLKLFAELATTGISLRAIAESKPDNPYLRRPVNFVVVENSLLWLIQVGILRREVDGQGITDSFRLTPMGHQMLEKWQPQGCCPEPSVADRIQNLISQLQPARFF